MQDPSQGIAPQLQNHVHLISNHRFPLAPTMTIEMAYRYLIDAPTIVSKTASMQWMFVQPPQDGTLWLEWIPLRNNEYRFASDGFIWGDQEALYRQEVGGYTIEWMVHMVGYRPGQDTHATHARTRYHFVSKNPGIHAAAPDPNLWMVHYYQTDPSRMIASPQVPISPIMSQLHSERKALEARGRIEAREFMLHDREHWPTVSLPNSHIPPRGYYGQANANLPQNRFPSVPGYQQQGQGGPPAKRQKFLSGGVPVVEPGHDTTIEDEENIALGDFFDHLTPREISMARYMQHHHWIEEVFSSPYASSQIVPADLGLGLMGELKGLTEGILDTPSLEEFVRTDQRPKRPSEAATFTNLKQEQVQEFNRRVEEHLKEGQAEIERLKEEHAAKMAEWKKSKVIMQAEKRLRYATWEGHEDAVPVYRVDVPPTRAAADSDVPRSTIEDIVKDVETLLGRKIGAQKDATVIQEGGLERDEQSRDEIMHDDSAEQRTENTTSAKDTATVNKARPIPSDNDVRSQANPQTTTQSAASQAPSQPAQQQPELSSGLNENSFGDADIADDDDMMGDMDIDVNISGVDFGDVEVEEPNDDTADTPSASNTGAVPATVSEANTTAATNNTTTTNQNSTQAAPNPPAAPSSISTNQPPSFPAGLSANSQTEHQQQNEPDDTLFDNTFADLADIGGEGDDDDDGLIDFDGGMGLDDSAFGDAMHGMGTDSPALDAGSGGDGSGAVGVSGSVDNGVWSAAAGSAALAEQDGA